MITQGDIQWRKIRSGRVTTSRFRDIVSERENTRAIAAWAPTWLSAKAKAYLLEILWERATGQFADRLKTKQMRHGLTWEEEARARAFCQLMDRYPVLERPVGDNAFLVHHEYDDVGCSPDFIVVDETGRRGLGELKCPWDGSRHAEAILQSDFLELAHRPQTQGGMWVGGPDIEFYLICSFDPRWEKAQDQLVIDFVPRDNQYIKCELAPQVERFRDYCNELWEKRFKLPEIDPGF